jgi:Ser/Thr protein kinase RdoA (MazF antagonist)
MTDARRAAGLPEKQLNELLRRVDWRFLLRSGKAPTVADMTAGKTSLAVHLIAAEAQPLPGDADLATIGFPTRLALRGAIESVRPGGEIVCLWRLPKPAGPQRAAARLRAAGLEGVQVLWPGPTPFGSPQFWLPLESQVATERLLASRPPRSVLHAILRPLWRAGVRAGLLAPICVIGKTPGGPGDDGPDVLDATFDYSRGLLLTGGRRSINKAVGVSLDPAGAPVAVVKFARVAAADEALEREAVALRTIEAERPGLPRVPRVLAEGRRAGRRALAESAVEGTPLIERLSPASFEHLAGAVTGWLIALARGGEPQAPAGWRERLVDERLRRFEREFGAVLAAGTLERLEGALAALGPLPIVPEHRDCSPWNVVLDADDAPGLHDWESAEPHGLPGLDLAYFLANCAFVLDGALESGRTRESHELLRDPSTPIGAIAARCEREYREALAIDAEDLARLRLLAWLVHSASDHNHFAMESGGEAPDRDALRTSTYLGLIEAELDSLP